MNIIEALGSFKRYRRKCWIKDTTEGWNYGHRFFDINDILATDWEIQPEPKKKEKRWLWSDENGSLFHSLRERPPHGYDIRLDWSEQEFEVDS